MSEKVWSVCFDTSFKERGKLDSNYTNFRKHLEQLGFACNAFAEFPITRKSLAGVDILVFPCPDFAKITPAEIDTLRQWVNEDGGGILMLSHAGGDKGRRSNLSELASQFGMVFENDQVLDKTNNLGVENLPTFSGFSIPHPIIEGVTSICYRAGCSLTNTGIGNTPVISSGMNSDPPETPLILAGEAGEGRVVAIGSYEMFRDKITGGFKHENHAQLATNIINWLKTTKRENIIHKKSAGIPASTPGSYPIQGSNTNVDYSAPSAQEATEMPNFAYTPPTSIPAAGTGNGPRTFTAHVDIKNKDDLVRVMDEFLTSFTAFKARVTEEMETMQANLSALKGAISAAEVQEQNASMPTFNAPKEPIESQLDSIGDALKAASRSESKPVTPSPSASSPSPAGLSPPPGLKPPPGFNPPPAAATPAPQVTPPSAEGLPTLTPLPGKRGQSQPAYSYPSEPAVTETTWSQPEYNPPGSNEIPNYTPPPPEAEIIEPPPLIQPNVAPVVETKEELQAELQSLEKKLVSFGELRVFVQKKFDTGKIDKTQYDKQIKKLESDINKSKYAIDEVKEKLKRM
jgi:uncharacterized membrane protein